MIHLAVAKDRPKITTAALPPVPDAPPTAPPVTAESVVGQGSTFTLLLPWKARRS